jgi:hypoxanthine-DNA glycosylase
MVHEPLDYCFPPIARRDATALILGSLPGRKSLERQQYYAHPQNQFWKLVAAVFEVPIPARYVQRKQLLTANGIALWDVFAAAERPGSLDSAIVHGSAETNDFRAFLRKHSCLRQVFFNGSKAEQAFRRYVLPSLGDQFQHIEYARLPSTSPAHAAMTFAQKLGRWRVIRTSR